MKKIGILSFVLLLTAAFSASAGTFVNGGFEDGNFNGWSQGSGSWFGSPWPLDPASYLPAGGGAPGVFAITNPGPDPIVGGLLNQVYAGSHSAKVNNEVNDYSVSVISQTVTNYTDAQLFFEWAAVLESSHGATDSDNFTLQLNDLTTGLSVLTRSYESFDNGSIFHQYNGYFAGPVFYTDWQVESIDIAGLGLTGHDLQLTMLASDCPYGGHWGYAYLDGFGSVIVDPGPGVPEPSSLLMMGGGLGALVMFLRRRRA